MRTLTALALVPCLLFSGAAAASVVVDRSVEELARSADLVLEGEVARTRTVVADEGRRIFTVATLRVDRTHKGAPAAEVEVLLPGGVAGELGQQVQGLTRLEAGERVFLFLVRRPGPRTVYEPAALGLSVFRIEGDRARRRTEGLEVVTGPLDRTPRPAPERLLSLDDLRRRVRAALAEEAR